MYNKSLDFTYRITIILLTLLLLGGCKTINKRTLVPSVPEKQVAVKPKGYMVTKKDILVKKHIQKKISNDVLVFRDLRRVDLNNDGGKKIVAIYITKSNLGGVKIIDEKTESIIFKQTFNTSNIKFRMSKGSPLIVVKDKNYLFGLGMNRVYQWDGKALIYLHKVISL